MQKTSSKTPDLNYIKGVGPFIAKCLQKLDISTVEELLGTPPKGYEDHRNLPFIAHLKVDQICIFRGYVDSVVEKSIRPKLTLLTVVVRDSTGAIPVQLFNQSFLKKSLKNGTSVLVQGTLTSFQGRPHVTGNRIEKDSEGTLAGYPSKIVPVYHLTKGLSQSKYRQVVQEVWRVINYSVTDPLPKDIREKCNLYDLKEAYQSIHFPKKVEETEYGRTRLAFDDFFYHQLALAHRKMLSMLTITAPKIRMDGDLINIYLERLPYTLTSAQQKAVHEIGEDIKLDKPMNRLVQGDVGAGKTEVAILTLLAAIQCGKKACFVAPTQVLAEQHFFKLSESLESLGVDVVLLKGRMRKKEKEASLEKIESCGPCVIVGTHAVIQPNIMPDSLGVVIVDEQHRFGVQQRMHFSRGSCHPHALFLSATPIPRSLVLTVYGDLEKTILDKLPPGRKPVKTVFMKPNNLGKIYDFCRKELSQGRQVYLVYPLVETSEKIDLKAAIEAYEELSEEEFFGYNVGLMHGQLTPKEKTEVMNQFKSKDTQVLVATTVIEVGVDVPNANVMVIHHAERFGLSQLHQLRGRVGRGSEAATCFLVGNPKTDSGKSRLQAMVDTQDGFKIAEKDLEIRGPGDFMGTRQSGLPTFPVGDLVTDQKILKLARQVAFHVAKSDTKLNHPGLKPMKRVLHNHYGHLLEGRLN